MWTVGQRNFDLNHAVEERTGRRHWAQGGLLYNVLLALFFEWGIGHLDVDLERVWRGEKDWREALRVTATGGT